MTATTGVSRYTMSDLRKLATNHTVCPTCNKHGKRAGETELVFRPGNYYMALLIPVECEEHGVHTYSVAI